MHHIAIMKPAWKLIPKILSGQKTIESRWYKNKSAPWDNISVGDTVWFKDSGKPVTARATVSNVIQLDDVSGTKLRALAKKYGDCPGICFVSDKEKIFAWVSTKRYTILIFLKDAKPVKPFCISKQGFGNACAWMVVNNINDVKIKTN